ncbi:unnamed protein product [Rhodiola kirilowii]
MFVFKFQKSGSESGSKRFGNHTHHSQIVPPVEPVPVCHPPLREDVGFIEANNDQQNMGAQSSERAPAALAPKITLNITRQITASPYAGKSKEDAAAIRIQTAYRGYLARRTLRALRGLVRLKFLVQGQAVKRQAANTLQCMQALARVQSQVRSRRVQMSKENQAIRKQLLQKNARKGHTAFRNSDDWKDCAQSKEQEEVKLKKRHEAALRRERTLAYSSVHQQTWKNSPKRTSDMTVADPDNPSWGWSWLERWMAGRPWEGQNATDEPVDSRQEIGQVEENGEAQTPHKPPPRIKTAPNSPHNPALKVASIKEKIKPGSSRIRLSNGSGSDSSEKNRRQSFSGSSARDYESSTGSNSPRRHTMPAMSLGARPRLQSPLGMEHIGTLPRKSSAVRQAEKPPSHLAAQSNPRRQSAPPKVRITSLTQQNQNITAEVR